MPNHCSECGAELREDSKFCLECGKKVEPSNEKPIESPPPQQEEQPTQTPIESLPSQQEEQPKKPISKPITPKKSRKKLMTGVLGVSIVAIIVVVIAVYFLGGTSPHTVADSRFVGEWEQNTIGNPRQWIFNSDSSLDIIPTTDTLVNGSWQVTNNQICLYGDIICYTFEFSDDGNIITLTRVGSSVYYPDTIVLSKKGLQGTSQTPEIKCTTDSSTNRVIIQSVNENVKWSDIAITADANATWQVQDTNNKGLARIGITATITTFMKTGESILLLDTIGEVTVTLRYIPTNAILGNWTVHV